MPCPNIQHCPNACRHLGVCTKNWFLRVEIDELCQPEIVRQIRSTTVDVTRAEGVKPTKVRDWLNDKYRDSRVHAINAAHHPVSLDMGCLEATDAELDAGLGEKNDEALREFFRTNACSQPRNGGRLFVTKRWHQQFVTMASVVGVSYPKRSQWWPRVRNGTYVDPRVANDNHPPRTE